MKRIFLINLAIGFFVWAVFIGVLALLSFTGGGSGPDQPFLVFLQLVASIAVVAFAMTPLHRQLQICPRCAVLAVAAIQGYAGFLALGALNGKISLAHDWSHFLLEPVGILIYTLPYDIAIAGLAVWIFARRFREARS